MGLQHHVRHSYTVCEASLFPLFERFFWELKPTFLILEYSSSEHARFKQAPQTARSIKHLEQHTTDGWTCFWCLNYELNAINLCSCSLAQRTPDECRSVPFNLSSIGNRMFRPPSGPNEVILSTAVQHSVSETELESGGRADVSTHSVKHECMLWSGTMTSTCSFCTHACMRTHKHTGGVFLFVTHEDPAGVF